MAKINTHPGIQSLLKNIPSVQELLSEDLVRKAPLAVRYRKQIVQEETERFRREVRERSDKVPSNRSEIKKLLLERIQRRIARLIQPSMKRVINGTGIILHTNLGRAPLAMVARKHLQEIIENYSNLEIVLETGKRGDRLTIVEEILGVITGAEAAIVVNNNAAALFLALNSLSRRKEVPVSRGELVEIGGSFRMPEVMKASGAKMVEVGTTNKTHLQDYAEAISEKTGAILKVHTSNYRVLGFTKTVPIRELVELAHSHDLPVIYDMGSGVIEDLQNWGYPHEPIAREYVEAGVDVITFSGDKVLGGPQAGIIIGKEKYLRKIRKNHLLRALRCDKLTYALLDATLRLYLNPEQLPDKLPVANMLTLSREELIRRGKWLKEQLDRFPLEMEVMETYAQMGSGALPLEKIPSVALVMKPRTMSLASFARKLRTGSPAVVGYIENDALYLNLRTIREDELELIVQAVDQIFS